MTQPRRDDTLEKAQQRGDFWKRMAERAQADRDRADKALAQAEQRGATLDVVLGRVRQMTDAWEQRLPESIATVAAVDAIRTALERADAAPPLDHRQQLDRAVAHLRSIPIGCTALTGPVWYGQGWQDAVSELEEYTDRIDDDQHPDGPTLAVLAPMFEGLERLIATSSRDWGQYRVDAWLWAVLVGWDCEEAEHDETCTHGAMEEMAELHGWDDEAVAKARRYRNAVRAVHKAAGKED